MPPDDAPHPERAGGRGRTAVPAVLGALFGGMALLLALLAFRTRREERRAGGPGRSSPTAPPGGPPPPAARPGTEVLDFFGELRPGTALDRWVLLEVGTPSGGAIPVRMSDAGGRPFDLQVLRRDPDGPRAPAEEGEVAVYLMGVTGGSATPEEQGLGAMTLAAALADAGRPLPGWLLTMRQRASAPVRASPPGRSRR